MMRQADDIRRFRARYDSDGAFFSQHKFAERLKEYLQETYNLKFNKEEEARFSELIADRVTGVVDATEFGRMLEVAKRSGGMGMPAALADEVTRYFEKLIAQGVDVSYK